MGLALLGLDGAGDFNVIYIYMYIESTSSDFRRVFINSKKTCLPFDAFFL